MRPRFLAVALLAAASACRTPDYGRPLPEGWPALLPLAKGEERPQLDDEWFDRAEILPALERSIDWYGRPSSREFFPIEGVTHERARASVLRMRELLTRSISAGEFDGAVALEFEFFKSAGWDGKGGGVLFTGYCTPILSGSLTADATYRHPLYALPDDLVKGPHGEILGQRRADGAIAPYPTRAEIEASAMLANKGLELVWLADPLDAFIAHVNGSAVVELPDGTERRYGYAGKNGREYRSLGRMLVQDGHIAARDISLPAIREWGREHPRELEEYIARDDSFVFFLEIDGNPRGSLNVEVTANRTLATDKSLFPRGALVFVDFRAPEKGRPFLMDRLMLDQDTGGAIRTAGRADVYMGVGPFAEDLAGRTKHEGQMYYVFLREDLVDGVLAAER
jgi:membrane-bound lytic murein transglycosylase A